jgi:hypothetical protein
VQAYKQIRRISARHGRYCVFAAPAGLRGASLRAQAPAAAKLSLCFFGKVFAQKASRRRQGVRLQAQAHTKKAWKNSMPFSF